jgi:hypothetical protein
MDEQKAPTVPYALGFCIYGGLLAAGYKLQAGASRCTLHASSNATLCYLFDFVIPLRSCHPEVTKDLCCDLPDCSQR